ncbi:MAG: iron-containing redox enzyme family protein, partial [Proteobacteria bacterium]
HKELTQFNHRRLSPTTPYAGWKEDLKRDMEALLLEGEMLETELKAISDLAARAPTDVDGFMEWFQNLEKTGPGQHDPLFDFLAEKATTEQMRWFIQQEVAGEAGFEDLTALTQVKFPTQPKLEMARNYWDEMGRGVERGMHGPMLGMVAQELGLSEPDIDSVVTESLALANILTAFASNRRYAYHSVGALGVIELTAPGRATKVHQGLKRLGLSNEGQRYYSLHAVIDIRHSNDWNKEVIRPLLEQNPEVARSLAEGALLRLYAGARCFDRYREELMGEKSEGKDESPALLGALLH